MNTCPSCGAAADRQQEPPPTRRTYYVCGSYASDNHTAYQSDLCFARQRIRDVRDIATTDSEFKEHLIARVRAILQE
jgi:2-hydroxy-3-keto-5-methylthiopentenyl-1-phosphate phosphatase